MRKAFVFDFDDTLATTDCRVRIMRRIDETRLEWLFNITPSQFNAYKLKDDEEYDFSEFQDDQYIHEADPTFLIHLAKEVHDEGHKVFILTARGLEVQSAIYVWMQSHGIEVDTIHCVTDRMNRTQETIAEKKKRILLDIVSNFDKVYFYDDSEENVNIFQHEKLRAYQVWSI